MTLRQLAAIVIGLGGAATVAAIVIATRERPAAKPQTEPVAPPSAEAPFPGALQGSYAARVEYRSAPNSEPMLGVANEIKSFSHDGRWLVRRLQGSVGDHPYDAAMMVGFDATQKQLTGSYTDSFCSDPALFDAEPPAAGKPLLGLFKGKTIYGSGKLVAWEESCDERRACTFELRSKGAQGETYVSLRIVSVPRD